MRLRTCLLNGVRRECMPCVSADLSPLISRLRDKLLAVFFPPRGSLFARFLSHCMTRQRGRIVKANHNSKIYLTYLPCTPRSPCSHSVQKASPWGEAVAQATDEGGSICTCERHTLPTRPAHQSGAIAALYTAAHRPTHQKLPCAATAAQRTQKIPTIQNGGCRAGKFGEVREVWRGRKSPFKGVPPPPRSSPYSPCSSSEPSASSATSSA